MGAWPGRLRANGVFHHGRRYCPGARRRCQDCEAVARRPTFNVVIRPSRVSSVGDSSRSLAAPDVPALLTVGLIGVEGGKTISVNRRHYSRPHRLAFGPPGQEASRFHGMAGQAGEAEESRLSRGTFSMCFRPPVYRHDGALPSSSSGWDREFESGLLQRRVTCELGTLSARALAPAIHDRPSTAKSTGAEIRAFGCLWRAIRRATHLPYASRYRCC